MSDIGQISRRSSLALLRSVAAFALCCLVSAAANAAEFMIVGDTRQAYVQSFISALTQSSQKTTELGAPRVTDLAATDVATQIGKAKVVVTIGNEAAKRYHPLANSAVMVHALMTEGVVESLKESGACGDSNHAVLLVEQPVERYLAAIRIALPGRNRLGVLYGPQSVRHAQRLRGLAAAYGFTLAEKTIASETEVAVALAEIVPNIDVLLTLPDQVVVNANTARTLILDTYQRGVPLVGYSNAMVKAGALMAIHSTPQQLGQQTASIIKSLMAANAVGGAKDFYPAEFDVSVNYQVARVLGVELPEENALQRQLMAQEKRP